MSRAIQLGFIHGEAFCLMWYACPCSHRERIWNSRDGVTPFAVSCPSCGGAMVHKQWASDLCDPQHTPWAGQRVFRDGTADEAEGFMRQRIDSCKGTQYEVDEERMAAIIKEARDATEGLLDYSHEFSKGWPFLYVQQHSIRK